MRDRFKRDRFRRDRFKAFQGIGQELRQAARRTASRPALAIAAGLILAMGIGSSIAVFSVLDRALLEPLAYPDADRLISLHNMFPKAQVETAGVSGYDYAELAKRKDVFENAGIYYYNDLTLTGLGAARHVDAINASASMFRTMGVEARLGRTFTTAEDDHDAPKTVVLSDAFWRSAMGADPEAIGRSIELDGVPYRVIGVMPREFAFPSIETQMWIPIGLRAGEFTLVGGRMEKWLQMVARLRKGVTLEGANASLATVGNALAAAVPFLYPAKEGWRFRARGLAEESTARVRRWLYVAFAAVLAVLLIACINVSALLLARGAATRSEVAVRVALGASRYRVMRQAISETALLVVPGCVGGVAFAIWTVRALNAYGPLPQPTHVRAAVVWFGCGLALACTAAAGLLPALATMAGGVEAWRGGRAWLRGGATRTATRSARWTMGVVTAQIALACALLLGATELSRSFVKLNRVPTGFDSANVWTGSVQLSAKMYREQGSWNTRFFEPLLAAMRAIPGVESAAIGGALPFNPSGVWTEELHFPGRADTRPPAAAQICVALPGYTETMRIPLLRGRTFTERDRSGQAPVAIVSAELARRYFSAADPIGKQIASGGMSPAATIVGVVGDVRNSDLSEVPAPEVYYPELQEGSKAMYLELRTNGTDPTGAVRAAIAKLDPSVALFDVRTMRDRVEGSLRLRRFLAGLLNGFGAIGLLLASVGLYGSLAHAVETRRREIGIRAALGAGRARLWRTVAGQGASVVMFGLTLGMAAAVLGDRWLRSQLFGVSVTDTGTWTAVLSVMIVAALAAVWIPAWRAARIDPAIALREE